MIRPPDGRARRGLVGLTEVARPPTTPREVMTAMHNGLGHAIARQTRSICANGIDKWWVESGCRQAMVVTAFAARPTVITCVACTDWLRRS